MRFFSCIGCQAQTYICRNCDHGNSYCGSECSLIARKKHSTTASKRYQSTRTGRFAHAERQRRYITRKNKMTHQGSHGLPICALLFALTHSQVEKQIKSVDNIFHCHFCGEPCSEFVRKGFLNKSLIKNGKISGVFPQGP